MVFNFIKNKGTLIIGCLLLTIFIPLNASAKTLVLVHGFLANDMSWRTSGFTKPLEMAGWQDAGSYGFGSWGMMIPTGIYLKGNIFITVNLPSQANLQNTGKCFQTISAASLFTTV